MLITHDRFVAEHAKRIVSLRDGRIVGDEEVAAPRRAGARAATSGGVVAPLESIRIAFGALRAHPMRSLLTMLGIIIGVAAVIAMVALGAGAQARVTEQIGTLGTNLLMVQPGAASEGGALLAGGTLHTLTEDDAAAIGGSVPGVLVAAPSVRGTGQLVHGNRNWNTVINGTLPDYFIAREWPLDKGRSFSEQEARTAAKVATGASASKMLFEEGDP